MSMMNTPYTECVMFCIAIAKAQRDGHDGLEPLPTHYVKLKEQHLVSSNSIYKDYYIALLLQLQAMSSMNRAHE